MILAWHFVRLVDGKPLLRDGRPMPRRGAWLTEPGNLKICAKGLHASYQLTDASGYFGDVRSAALCLVEVDGVAAEHSDKLVARRRRVIDWIDVEPLYALADEIAPKSGCGCMSCRLGDQPWEVESIALALMDPERLAREGL